MAHELDQTGFYIHSDWHDRFAISRNLRLELLHLMKADIMLINPAGVSAQSWIKLGFAISAGIRIIAIGAEKLDIELSQFFVLNVATFEDLRRNHFLALGSGRWKKGQI